MGCRTWPSASTPITTIATAPATATSGRIQDRAGPMGGVPSRWSRGGSPLTNSRTSSGRSRRTASHRWLTAAASATRSALPGRRVRRQASVAGSKRTEIRIQASRDLSPRSASTDPVDRGADSLRWIRSRPSPAGSTDRAAANSALRMVSSYSRSCDVIPGAQDSPCPDPSSSRLLVQHGAQRSHGPRCVALDGSPANPHGRCDLGLGQVPVIAKHQRLTLPSGQRAQRVDDR